MISKSLFYMLLSFYAISSFVFAEGLPQASLEKKAASSARLPAAFELASPAFKNDGPIPEMNTCRAANWNPPLVFKNVPQGTKSFALTVFDPQGTVGPWVHWVVFNIRPDMTEIKEDSVPGIQALNDFGNFYYSGPCPMDQKSHRYIFTVYALNAVLSDANEGATKDTLEKVMAGKIIAKAELTGTYQINHWE